jgi:hypothetical protein
MGVIGECNVPHSSIGTKTRLIVRRETPFRAIP